MYARQTIVVGVLISIALLFFPNTPLPANDSATQPAMLQFGFVAGKSFDKLDEFSRNIGFFLGFNENSILDQLEQKYAFVYVLQTEWLARDKPLAVAFVGTPGRKADIAQTMVFVLPVRTDVNILQWLRDHGATAEADHPDTVLLNGVALRRSTNQLLVSANSAALSAVNAKAIADAVGGEDALARLSIDLKWVRQNMPDAYKQATAAAAQWTRVAWLLSPMVTLDSLDRLDATLDDGKNGFRFAVTASPVILQVPPRINRPGMPSDVVFRLDWGVPLDAAFPPTRELYATINDIFPLDHGEPLSVQGGKERASFMERRAKLERDPTAMSIGVGIEKGSAVVYVRQHWTKEIDVFDELRHMAASFNAVNAELKSGKNLEAQTYQSGDDPILRFTLKDSGKPIDYLDVAQKGREVFLTASTNDQNWVGKLIASPDEVPMTAELSGLLDLGTLANRLDDVFPDSGPDDLLPKDVRPLLAQTFANEKIVLATSRTGNAATFEMTGSKDLIRKLGALAFVILFRH